MASCRNMAALLAKFKEPHELRRIGPLIWLMYEAVRVVFIKVLIVVVLASPACLLSGCGEESAAPDTQSASAPAHNAADEYRSLYAGMGEPLIAQLKDSAGALTGGLVQSLPATQPVIDRLVWATRLERCDWGIDYSAGYDTELPRLPKLRELTRLLLAHAQQAVRAGEMDTAAEDVAAIVRMSRHVGGKTPIEAMVAFAILRVGTDMVIDNASRWDRSHRNVILAELERIDPRDPFGGEAMMEWDKRLAAQEGVAGPDEQVFRAAQNQTVNGLREAIKVLD